MRILHLLDPGSPGSGASILKLAADPISRIRSIDHVPIVVGNDHHAAVAQRCGIDIAGHIAAPARRPILGRHALRALLDEYENAGQGIDLIHAWSAESLLMALGAAAPVRILGTLPIGPAGGLTSKALAIALEQRPVPMMALSSQIASEHALSGVPAEDIHVIAPAVNETSLNADQAARTTLRHRWSAGPHTLVVGLLAEPPEWSDARAAATICLMAELAAYDVRLVVHPSAARRVETRRWLRDSGHEELMTIDDEIAEPWRIVHGLDAALVLGDDTSTDDLRAMSSPLAWLVGGGRRLHPSPAVLPLLWAAIAGLPIIGEATTTFSSIIDDGASGLLVNKGDVNAAADRVMRLAEDRQLAGRLGSAARSMARTRFSVSAFCVRLKELYLNAAMEPEEKTPAGPEAVQTAARLRQPLPG
jgi:hypothetical protein